ncbi:PREDICTED: elongator complex protein 6-like [Branchiostoma belcheri]|uniref:Elongator complex protein 6 n=1 Tax=Branchiostoma belcheri TaxID=7741 RepID=A0A6P4XN68_BRABE|nr:PREDICTED: elongator complex protein 6-like [Branchiostoma belcheri]
MFTELNTFLGFDHLKPPKGQFVLISDSLTDDSFLIHHFLSLYIKGGWKVCLLALAQSFGHYNAVGQKLGVHLSQAREKGQLRFIDGLKCSLQAYTCTTQEEQAQNPLRCLCDKKATLRPLYDQVKTLVCSEEGVLEGPTLLLVDDLSVLVSLGMSVKDVADFMHYCRVLMCPTLQSQGAIVSLVHKDADVEDEENSTLFRHMAYHSTVHLAVEGLSSGYSRDVHGQVTVTFRNVQDPSQPQTRMKTLQYKVEERNVSFFAPGTSRAVL